MAKVLSLNIHYKCNAKCIFCVVGIPENPIQENKYNNLENIVNDLEIGYKNGYRGLVLSGGEPTIHPHIVKTIKKAKDIGYKHIEMKTNGIKLENYEFTKAISEAGLDTFCISIHGPDAKTHDYLVGVPGAFNKIKKAIENIKKIYGVNLITPTCIQKDNYKLLPQTIDFLLDLGTTHICLTFVETNGSAKSHFNKVVPRYKNVIPYLYEAIEKIKESNILWNIHGFPMCLVPGYEYFSLDIARHDSGLAGTDIHDYNTYEKEHFRKKDEIVCNNCILDSFCSGPWANYVENYGFDEFNAVTANSITDIIPLPILSRKLFKIT